MSEQVRTTRFTPADLRVKRFYWLDISRFFAAIAVVFSHYSHFFHYPTTSYGDTSRQPAYDLLRLLYDYGGFGVQFFFVLSGFIFFHFYAQQVSSKKVGASRFFVLRFSRLYPLHFLTLIIVAALQLATVATLGESFIYHENDFYHFALQLFFASEWGVQNGHSFNGPIWSVSLEVLAYALFFILVRFIGSGFIMALAISALGFLIMRTGGFWHGMIIACFFVGGLAAESYRIFTTKLTQNKYFIFGTASILLVTSVIIWSVAEQNRPFGLRDEIVWGIAMPMLVLSLALFDTFQWNISRRLAPLGDMTYASYLVHFPLQLIMAPMLLFLGGDPGNGLVLAWYLGLTIIISVLTYHCVELPAQSYLRQRMMRSHRG